MKKAQTFKVGDSVAVKSGIKDPDFSFDIGGWQGRVSEIVPKQGTLCIDLDSITLKSAPYSYIAQCEEKGFGWDQIYLKMDEIEPTQARDTPADVQQTVAQLEIEHAWDFLGSEGAITRQVLKGIDPDDEFEAFEAWERHLNKVLQFPFDAEIAEPQERGPLRSGYKVRVHHITSIEGLYGIMVKMTYQHRTYHFPLCDLEAIDKASENYGQLRQYVVWFANR